MPRYCVEIVEKTSRLAIIEAASPADAEAIAERLWSETEASYDNFSEGETWHDVNTEYTDEVDAADESAPVFTADDLAEIFPKICPTCDAGDPTNPEPFHAVCPVA